MPPCGLYHPEPASTAFDKEPPSMRLSPTDGGRKDVQDVAFFEGGALDVAQANAVQQNKGIVLYFPIQMNPGSFELRPELRAEFRLELSECVLYVVSL